MGRPLNEDEIKGILSQSKGRGPTRDPTEPREITTWFKLNHVIRTEGCENPDCVDTRQIGDRGRNIGAIVKGKHMCHYCFLEGWLSEAKTTNTSSTSN